jgi:hypothetical protein
MMNRLADLVHPQSQISTFVDYPNPLAGYDVFFAKGVSLLYKVDTTNELARVLSSATISIFDYSFSLKGNRKKILGSGKPIHYLDVGEAREMLKDAGGFFVVRTGETRVEPEQDRVFVNGLYGNREAIHGFIGIDGRMRQGLIEGCWDDTFSDLMLAGIEGGEENWVPFDDFCDAHLGN